MAGVNPFNVGLTITGFEIGANLPGAFDFEILTPNLVRFYMGFHVDKNTIKNDSILLNIRGNGAAIAVKHADKFEITRCYFRNNTGTYGGALYAAADVSLTVDQCSFFSGEILPTFVSGILIQSYCNYFYLWNSHMEIVIPSDNNISAVYHNGDQISRSLLLRNSTMVCPFNTRLAIQNATTDMKGIAFRLIFPTDSLVVQQFGLHMSGMPLRMVLPTEGLLQVLGGSGNRKSKEGEEVS